MSETRNIHATAIVVGTTGLLFVGPSGSGKSASAFACMAEARMRGLFSALIADDQVLISVIRGHIIASAPTSIAGRMELRGSAIVGIRHIPRALLHLAILPGQPSGDGRLPDEGERFPVDEVGDLPAARLFEGMQNPLAALAALHPDRLRL